MTRIIHQVYTTHFVTGETPISHVANKSFYINELRQAHHGTGWLFVHRLAVQRA